MPNSLKLAALLLLLLCAAGLAAKGINSLWTRPVVPVEEMAAEPEPQTRPDSGRRGIASVPKGAGGTVTQKSSSGYSSSSSYSAPDDRGNGSTANIGQIEDSPEPSSSLGSFIDNLLGNEPRTGSKQNEVAEEKKKTDDGGSYFGGFSGTPAATTAATSSGTSSGTTGSGDTGTVTPTPTPTPGTVHVQDKNSVSVLGSGGVSSFTAGNGYKLTVSVGNSYAQGSGTTTHGYKAQLNFQGQINQ